jgi:hypothetical protein
VTVTVVDDAPVLGQIEASLTFTPGDLLAAPQDLFEAPAVSDPDTASLSGGEIRRAYAAGGDANDQLTLRDTVVEAGGSNKFGIEVEGSAVYFYDNSSARTQIGTIDGTENGSGGQA